MRSTVILGALAVAGLTAGAANAALLDEIKAGATCNAASRRA